MLRFLSSLVRKTDLFSGGESIKDMQNTTGCKINIFQSVPREVDRRVSLTGSKKSIEQAKLAIQDKVHAAVSLYPHQSSSAYPLAPFLTIFVSAAKPKSAGFPVLQQ